MSNHKTVIDQELVSDYLKDNFSGAVTNFESIFGGEASQAYKFDVASNEYVIRVNKHYSGGFKKDKYAFENFSVYGIPIPKIIKIDKDKHFNYCISERAKGSSLNTLTTEIDQNLIEQIFTVLAKIHSVDVSSSLGYGKWNQDGVGSDKNWTDRLLRVDEHIQQDSGINLFKDSFLEKKLWDKFYDKLVKLVDYCPTERYLVHGDYSHGNILASDHKITGVVDWESSMYGDFLLDVAWLGFWSKKIDYIKIYQERSQSNHIKIPNFEERILCYHIYFALGSLSFYAYSEQEEKYNKIKDKLYSL